ncbi:MULTISPECIES: LemA family protein [unclassified Cellulophaga]|uniref:LemA family protein n=1 Tax=unclassified Cellulophaga TaxID=2634405 RepID=UPI0026E340D4|nr:MULTISPECIES: LemA family protein [unclassified Cellulophaga]MDO6490183.1 LemA family protein [Cellulophaga sp. 2_MG-2023]MDO6494623.1 LemA family protein [Cellulophaga sp. 3_MG-2023]
MGAGIIVTLVVLAVIVITIISIFNKMTRAKNQIENSISSLDASYIKRSDLIPNLVETVKQYMTYEKGTLEKITALRSSKSNSDPAIEKEGSQALKNLMIQVENYPELKANSQFTNLQYSWNESEEQIAAGRRYISTSITHYNNSISTFPANTVAKLFGFKSYQWQYATKEQQENIKANELFN